MTNWQPIETAPKDGRRILLFQPSGDGDVPNRTVAEGSWATFAGRGLMWCMEAGDGWTAPTHWMPLPEPPNGGAS